MFAQRLIELQDIRPTGNVHSRKELVARTKRRKKRTERKERRKGPLPESNWRLAARYNGDRYPSGRLLNRNWCVSSVNRGWCIMSLNRVGIGVDPPSAYSLV